MDFVPSELGANPVFDELLTEARERLDKDGVRETLRHVVEERS